MTGGAAPGRGGPPRRRLVRRASAARALLVAGLLLGAACRPGEAPVVVGSGDWTFEWVDRWARSPDGTGLGYTHGRIAVDRSGRVYVQTEGERAVQVFAPDGTFLRSFGAELANGLHGMALVEEDGEEFLYLTHIRHGAVYKTTLDGEVLWRLGWPEESGLYEREDQYHPTGVAVASNGDLYVADGYGLSWVHRYDAERRYLGSFGGQGRAPGRLRNPHGLWLDEAEGREPLLWVADRENRRLQVFDREGELQKVWLRGLRRPCYVEGRGDVLAVADIDGVVTLLARDGEPLARLGDNPDPEGRDRRDVPAREQVPGVFVSPHGLAWTPEGDLLVTEWLEEGRITRLVRRGGRP